MRGETYLFVIVTGGIEENGPYLTTGNHNNAVATIKKPMAQ